jgi:hypothetical protein
VVVDGRPGSFFLGPPSTKETLMTETVLSERDLRSGTESARARPMTAADPAATSPSAVSWAAILAGAAGAAALSLILLILGTGLGLSSVSPWAGRGADASTLGISTILWLLFTQLAAAGMGGYLAGRLRSRWVATHTDEVYFRDTAHGFLAWSIATLATAALLTSAIGAILGGGASAVGAAAGGAGTAAIAGAGPMAAGAARQGGTDSGNGYFVDGLFRQEAAASAPAAGATPADAAQATSEAGRIFAAGLESGALPADDRHYLGQLVSQKTGLAPADAERRVDGDFARLKAKADQARADALQAADKARKASAWSALWLFVSLLLGAFVASVAATLGGRQRDLV